MQTRVLLSCVSVTVTGGIKEAEKFADVICTCPRRRYEEFGPNREGGRKINDESTPAFSHRGVTFPGFSNAATVSCKISTEILE